MPVLPNSDDFHKKDFFAVALSVGIALLFQEQDRYSDSFLL